MTIQFFIIKCIAVLPQEIIDTTDTDEETITVSSLPFALFDEILA
ncbi:MAG: hypothetical protein Q8M94_16605 [Ignavibacteria bacterium]|nr:hypothetical protein [Ignavibacteria bacterium]